MIPEKNHRGKIYYGIEIKTDDIVTKVVRV